MILAESNTFVNISGRLAIVLMDNFDFIKGQMVHLFVLLIIF